MHTQYVAVRLMSNGRFAVVEVCDRCLHHTPAISKCEYCSYDCMNMELMQAIRIYQKRAKDTAARESVMRRARAGECGDYRETCRELRRRGGSKKRKHHASNIGAQVQDYWYQQGQYA